MIIDCHGHFNTGQAYAKNAERYVKYDFERPGFEKEVRTFKAREEATSVDLWVQSLDRYGVDKIVLQTAPYGDNDAVAEFVKGAPDRFIPLANIDFFDPEGSNPVQELERCVNELGLKGIGELYPQIGPWDPGDEKVFPIYEKAQELGVPIMIHGGTEFGGAWNDQRYSDPYMLDPALRAFPNLNFIVCHTAQDYAGKLFNLMRARRNVYAEISAFSGDHDVLVTSFWYAQTWLDLTPQYLMGKFLSAGLEDRIVWANDTLVPYDSPLIEPGKANGTLKDNHVVKILDELAVSEETKAKILGGNAARIFNV